MNIKSLTELETKLDYFSQFSFDVFDTLIFRTVEDHSEREIGIAKLVANYLTSIGIACDYQDYVTLREIEFQKSKAITGDEIDYFPCIHNILTELSVPAIELENVAKKVWKIEEDYEISVAYANPEALEILPRLKAAGKRIVAISDMYLPNSSVRAILNAAGLLVYFDDVYVSSDNKLTKHSGKIYAHLLANGSLVKNQVVHTGDNYHSDEKMAINNLIFGLHYVNTTNELRKKKVYEKIAKKHSIHLNAASNDDDLVDVLSQSFALFLKQIFDTAKKFESRNIFFFTRDANFLLSSAEKYSEMSGLTDLKLETLHLDRLNSFFLNIDSLELLERNLWLFGDSEKVTVYDFFKKIGYLDKCLEKYAEVLEANKNIPLKMALVTNHLKEIILEFVKIKHKTIVDYLTYKGVFSKENSILVDIGYSGTSMREISFYLQNNAKNNVQSQQGRLDCILFASNRFFNDNAIKCVAPVQLHLVKIFPFHKVNFFSTLNHSWLEPFVLDSSLGPLERYEETTLQPVRKKYTTVPVYQKVELNKKIESFFPKLDHLDLKTLQNKLELLSANPSKQQVEKYAFLTHIKGFDNSSEQPLIKKVSMTHIKNDITSLIREDYWVGASLAKSNLSFLIKLACSHFYYAKKFFKI